MRSSSIPVNNIPDFEEVQRAIAEGFSYFHETPPQVANRLHATSPRYDPYAQGSRENEWAWISSYKCRDDDFECNQDGPFYIDIQSRGDDLFAALVCFSLCKAFGQKIYDDAGYLKAGVELTLGEFESALQIKLNK